MVFGICNYICVVICVAEVTMFVFFCTSVDRLSHIHVQYSTKHYGVCESRGAISFIYYV